MLANKLGLGYSFGSFGSYDFSCTEVVTARFSTRPSIMRDATLSNNSHISGRADIVELCNVHEQCRL
jgi:hypothetical protein